MKALDTNVLVRFLVQDDSKQVKKVNQLFQNTEAEKQQLYISLLVILELVWVLESVYEVSRQDLLDAINELLSMPLFQFEKQSIVRTFINASKNNNVDLSDLLIGVAGLAEECETTLTFDKKAARSEFFKGL